MKTKPMIYFDPLLESFNDSELTMQVNMLAAKMNTFAQDTYKDILSCLLAVLEMNHNDTKKRKMCINSKVFQTDKTTNILLKFFPQVTRSKSNAKPN